MGNSAAGLSSRSARGIAYVGGEYPATEPHQFNPVVNFQGTGVVFVDLVQDPNDSTWSRKQLTYVPIDTDQFTVGTKKVLEADVSIEEAFGRGMHLQRQVSLSADGDSVVYSNNVSSQLSSPASDSPIVVCFHIILGFQWYALRLLQETYRQ
eukprot:GEZU01007800.1.p1 GENE.GEZU01007800.1~~GEZU01007800.1.p1  ORF type:complete len:152 (-),score=14.16 GEZU01007800.1:113-568(-)